ncbi:4-hydroxyphenylacetate 3-hydroxylase family protein [Saccharopolyspora taberi]|uniref:4-hydroxyphenylacetate 3-hydroxylase N-terminal domain-containing protein n=1 Tax=Saccharopolyspora taberi TaxID=60895 RepID=A0ABN3VHL9_9PSEU
MRTGKEYLAALSDGRTVYLDGAKVADVADHPAFRGVTNSVAKMYDFAARPENGMLQTAPETGAPALKPALIPRSAADLATRHEAIAKWSALSHGWVGRGPDHVASFFAGFAGSPGLFDRDPYQLSGSVDHWYRKLLAESPFLTYVLTPPQTGRMPKPADSAAQRQIPVVVTEETDEGIVVRGSQMLGTSSAVSDYIFVSRIQPVAPEDSDQALSFVVPANAPGVRLYCRRPYGPGQPSVFDYPLSTRFDESDATVVFEDVFVPWEDVFVCRDVEGVRAQFFDTAAHSLSNHQAQVRLVVKLQFILGVIGKICGMNQTDRNPAVVEKLGELASLAAMVEACLIASEAEAITDSSGVARPNPRFLYGAMGMQSEVYPRVLRILRELVGGGVIQLPSSRDELLNAETAPDFQFYLSSPGVPAEERIKLFKLAWDMIGSEFGSRHHQYEMFYAGPPFVAKANAFRHYDFTGPRRAVEEFLSSYDLHSQR